ADFLHTFCPGGECAENRFDYRKTLVLQCVRHDFLHTFWPITLFLPAFVPIFLKKGTNAGEEIAE
ncbi:hypothetical protein ACLD5S_06230, partial [Gardnerella vaginalis]|uniref:hypothetical protein n=1 Tax=Gardnerella vaginalis TaxID=2702 RepID=UPI003970A493